jgi:hypothetical protein
MQDLQIGSPNPEPVSPLVPGREERLSGLNNFSMMFCGIPIP